MSYIGSTPTTQSFIAGTDYFNGTGSQTAFTLSRSVVSVNDIEVVINNVVQQPNTAYTVSGTTITFTSAPSAGTANIYVRYLSTTTQSITPSQNTVSYSTLNSDTQSKLGISFKNRIINGAMVIDQRNAGASVTLTAANFVYPVDRMFAFRASGTSGAIAQQVSSGITGGAYALRTQRNSGDSSTAALGWGQVLESLNCLGMAGSSVTLSFNARIGANFSGASNQIVARIGTGTGTNQSSSDFYNNAWTGQSNTNTAITLTTTWNSYSVTIPVGSSVNQLGILFYYTPVGTASTNDWFEITNVQLEVGTQATTFDYRSYGTELALCQRYYRQTTQGFGGSVASTTTAVFVGTHPVPMRTTPTVAGTAIQIYQLTQAGAPTQSSFSANATVTDPTNYTLECGNFSGLTTYFPVGMVSGKITFSAEL